MPNRLEVELFEVRQALSYYQDKYGENPNQKTFLTIQELKKKQKELLEMNKEL